MVVEVVIAAAVVHADVPESHCCCYCPLMAGSHPEGEQVVERQLTT